MSVQDFDSQISLGILTTATLQGGITGLTVMEKDETGIFVPTNNIMRTDRDWQITLNWELVGTLLDIAGPPGSGITVNIPGNFVINAYLEGLGKSADGDDLNGDTAGGIPVMGTVNKVIVPAGSIAAGDPVETEWKYSETVTIKAPTSPNPPTLKPGAYRLAVNLTYGVKDSATGVFKPGPMAGFMELPDMIQIYDPGT